MTRRSLFQLLVGAPLVACGIHGRKPAAPRLPYRVTKELFHITNTETYEFGFTGFQEWDHDGMITVGNYGGVSRG